MGQITRSGHSVGDVYIHTLKLGCLVLRVEGTTVALPQLEGVARRAQQTTTYIPLFPPVARFNWPPATVLNDDTYRESTIGLTFCDLLTNPGTPSARS